MKGSEMDFPCSVNKSMYATIWRTKKVTLLSKNDTIMPPLEKPVSLISTEADDNFLSFP